MNDKMHPNKILMDMMPSYVRSELQPKLIPKTCEGGCSAKKPTPSIWSILESACATPESRARTALVDFTDTGEKVEYTYRAMRLEARTLAERLQHNFDIKRGDTIAVLLDNSVASVVAAYAIAGLGARRLDLNTRLSPDELAARFSRVGNIHAVIAGCRFSNIIARAFELLMNNYAYSALDELDPVMPVLYAAHPSAKNPRLPEYDASIREFADVFIESSLIQFDTYSAASGGVDYVPGGTDGFDTFSSESDEPTLSLLRQLSRGDALRWMPIETDEVLLDAEFQIMFTSGTSGEPKVIVHTQRQVMMHAMSVASCYKMTHQDVYLHVAPIFHAMDACAMYSCVHVGAKQVMTSNDLFDGSTTVRAMKDVSASTTALTPTHVRLLLRERCFREAATHLRMLSVGGATVSTELIDNLMSHCPPDCTYFTDYGCTEACGKVCTTIDPSICQRSTHDRSRAGIAMPLFDVVVVKDGESFDSVSWNDEDSGEVVIRGPTVASAGWHRTGDIGVVDKSGSLKIIDRVSDLIIVGGENVYPNEIESTLLSRFPEIVECAAFGVDDELLGEVVHVAVVTDKFTNRNKLELWLQHCASNLADFKVPQRFVFMDALPKNSMGKVLKSEIKRHARSNDPNRSGVPGLEFHAALSLARTKFAHAMGIDETLIDAKSLFMNYGVRSTQAVLFANTLAESLGVELPSTLMFDHPNLESLALHLSTSTTYLAIDGDLRAASENHLQPIFIADTRDDYSNVPDAIPLSRFDVSSRYTFDADNRLGAINAQFAYTIGNVETEDLLAVGIVQNEAAYIDPHQRLLLRQGLPMLSRCKDTTTGVYVACMWNDDYDLSKFPCVVDSPHASLGTGVGLAFCTGRLSFFGNTSGPSIGIDTACSSGLITLSLGRSHLLDAQCESVYCAGTNLIISVYTHSKICNMNALSHDGRCKTLDASADGYGRAEGVASCVLTTSLRRSGPETLVDVGVNQDARSSSLVAPRGSAQESLIRNVTSAYSTSGTFTAYGMHGTGTELGDPIETSALLRALATTGRCAPSILSSKSIRGHSEGTSGLAGFLSSLECLNAHENAACFASLRNLNPYALRAHASIRAGFPRAASANIRNDESSHIHAGVSAFGMSGTNASCVIRESKTVESARQANRCPMTDLSAWCSVSPHRSPFVHRYRPRNTLVAHIDSGTVVESSLLLGMAVESAYVLTENACVGDINLSAESTPRTMFVTFTNDGCLRAWSPSRKDHFCVTCRVSKNAWRVAGRTSCLAFKCHLNAFSDDARAVVSRPDGLKDHLLNYACFQSIVEAFGGVLQSISNLHTSKVPNEDPFVNLSNASACCENAQIHGISCSRKVRRQAAPSADFMYSSLWFAEKVEDANEREKRKAARNTLSTDVRKKVHDIVVSHTNGDVGLDTPLMAAGLDSLSANELKANMETEFGIDLPPTLVFDYPTERALLKLLTSVLSCCTNNESIAMSLSAREGDKTSVASTIVTCHLVTSRGVSRAPFSRWNQDWWMDTQDVVFPFCSGFFKRFDFFDARLFDLASVESLVMDPQQRVLLECAYAIQKCWAFDERTDVVVGLTASHYKSDVLNKYWGMFHPSMGTGNLPSVAAGRLSYVFSYRGLCVSVDTACSSSLVATSIAHTSSMGAASISGGSVAILSGSATIDRHHANMLSLECRCKTLDAAADGFVEGEAIGLLALTSSDEASGVMISGSAVNQDGRSASLTAPNGPAQKVVIGRALSLASVSYFDKLQMHGTGTPLGDPIELGAAVAVISSPHAVSLEAIKSHLGHCETASGVVSLCKVFSTTLACMLDQISHLRFVNAHCVKILDSSSQTAIIPREVSFQNVKHAGTSSFAFQGTNAHTILSLGKIWKAPTLTCAFDHQRIWPLPIIDSQIHECAGWYSGYILRYKVILDPRLHSHLLDHIVLGRNLYPGSGFHELAASCARTLLQKNITLADTSIPVALDLRKNDVTVVDARVCVTKSNMTIQTRLTHMTCFITSQHRHARGVLSRRFVMTSRKEKLCCALVPSRDAHSCCVVHPATLDNALQLGAILDIGSTNVVIPTGAHAYFSNHSNDGMQFAVTNDMNHSLNNCRIFGLKVRTMGVEATDKERSSSDTYKLHWFAVGAAHADRRLNSLTQHMSFIGASVFAAFTALQSEIFHDLLLEAVDMAHSAALRAVFRSIAQERSGDHFEVSKMCLQDKAYARHTHQTHTAGVAVENAVKGSIAYEPRLRRTSDHSEKRYHRIPTMNNNLGRNFQSLTITGGLGAIGIACTHHYAALGWRVLTLSRIGRTHVDSFAFAHLDGLVTASKCDTSRMEDMHNGQVLDTTELRHILHAAGTLQDALIQNQSSASVFAVLGPKASCQLPRLVLGRQACILSCSSIAALTGNPGQCNYAAANAILDSNAMVERNRGIRHSSVQWGGWASIGMAARDLSIAQRLVRIGAGVVEPRRGLDIIHTIFEGTARSIAVSPFSWDRVSAALPRLQIFSDLLSTGAKKSIKKSQTKLQVASTNAGDIQQQVSKIIDKLVGRSVDVDAPLMEAGLDSQAANELKNNLDEVFDVDVPATVAYDYPNISALSAYIISLITVETESSVETARALIYTTGDQENIVANITAAELLAPVESGDGTIRVPSHRWDYNWWWDKEGIIPSFSCFLSDYEYFDAPMFGISSGEALLQDCQQRSILEGVITTRLAGEHKLREDGFADGLCGVYVAISAMQYQVEVLDRYWPNQTSPYIATGNTLSVAAGRVSFTFGLRGPCFSLDTACSSSIVAMHLTLQGFRVKDCTSAHTCGVISILGPGVSTIFYASGMLSSSGRCKTLDAAADGYVRGEARGVFLMHCVEATDAFGVAVVGSAINQDGRSGSLTAPNGPSQQAVMIRAVLDSCTTGSRIDKLQMHGTGTPLGDPIEVGATMAVLHRNDFSTLTLEAIKSHVGHTETASGMVAMMQPLHSLVHAHVEKILHLRWINPHVDSIVSRLSFVALPRQNAPRHCSQVGVSSFAFQGTNANLVQRLNEQAVVHHPITTTLLEKQRYYPLPILHPQLLTFTPRAKHGHQHLRFHAKINTRVHGHLLDHRVLDRSLYPGAGFQELVCGAARIFDATSFAALKSTIPMPLYMSTTQSTTFNVHVDACTSLVRVHSGSADFMKCCISRVERRTVGKVPWAAFPVQSPSENNSLQAVGNIRALASEKHLDYFVHPACLDCALQLGAVMMIDSTEVKVPVGVRSFYSCKAPSAETSLRASANSTAGNYSLRETQVVGLEVRGMRQGARRMDGRKTKMLYVTRWYVTKKCEPGRIRICRDLEASALRSVLMAACAVQVNTSTGIDVGTIRTESNDAIHGFMRTVGQEIAKLRTEGVRFDSMRTQYVAPSRQHNTGESFEMIVLANVCFECRLSPDVRLTCQQTIREAKVFSPVQSSPAREIAISGGLGAIGCAYACHMNHQTRGALKLHLMGRSGRSVDFKAEKFTHVRINKCDAGLCEELRPVASREIDELLHAAGVLADMAIRNHSSVSIRRVIAAKVDSCYNMEHQFYAAKLVRVIHCSSIAALAGSSGQSNYSAANACLDSIAVSRRQRGDSQSSIQWGAWANSGMASAQVLQKVDSMGFGVVTPEQGMIALEHMFKTHNVGNVVATPYDWKKFAKSTPIIQRIYRDVVQPRRVPQRRARGTSVSKSKALKISSAQIKARIQSIVSRVVGREVNAAEPLMDAGLDSLSGQEMKQQIEDEFSIELTTTAAFDYPNVEALAEHVAAQIQAEELVEETYEMEPRFSPAEVESRISSIVNTVIGREVSVVDPLMDAGLDSLSGQEMKQQIEDEFEIELPATIAFDYPTIRDLAAYVSETIGTRGGSTSQRVAKPEATSVVAIPRHVVVRCVDLLVPNSANRDCVSRVPNHRWDIERYQDGLQEYMRRYISGYNLHIPAFSAFIPSYRLFDVAAFGISPLEGLYMDPQQRSLLEGVLKVHLTSGITAQDTTTGVYVGIVACDYADEVLRRYEPVLHPYLVSGTALNVASGRISYVYNFRGPAMSIDTACSSSVVTTHSALSAIRAGEITRAMSCGVQALLSEHVTGVFHSSGMLAADGRCKALDVSADGYVRGEARGVIYLEILGEDEKNDGIFLAGSCVNQDGRSSSLTAPNGPTQRVVIQTALSRAQVLRNELDQLQLHGTGTTLGDPIEFGAALGTLERSQDDSAATFEAVKSQFGHTESAAGAVAIILAIENLSDRAKSLTFHLKSLSPHCQSLIASGVNSPVSVPKQASGINTSSCAVSGFAFQGTNANAVLTSNFECERTHPGSRNALFSRETFWPLPWLNVHLPTFDGVRENTFRFTAKVDARLHSRVLGVHVLSQTCVFPAAGFLELTCSASRLFMSDPVSCKSSIFEPLELSKQSTTCFAVEVNAMSGYSTVKHSHEDSFMCMRCHIRRTESQPRSSVKWTFAPRERSPSDRRAKLCVAFDFEQDYLDYHTNPCAMESVLSGCAIIAEKRERGGILRSCELYWSANTKPRYQSDSDAVIADDSYRLSETVAKGAVFTAPSRVARILKTTSSSSSSRVGGNARDPSTRLTNETPPMTTKPVSPSTPSRSDILSVILSSCSTIIGIGTDEINAADLLSDVGIDSLSASELRAAIQHEFGVSLPIQAAFDCPTADALASRVFAALSDARRSTFVNNQPPRGDTDPHHDRCGRQSRHLLPSVFIAGIALSLAFVFVFVFVFFLR